MATCLATELAKVSSNWQDNSFTKFEAYEALGILSGLIGMGVAALCKRKGEA